MSRELRKMLGDKDSPRTKLLLELIASQRRKSSAIGYGLCRIAVPADF